MHQPVLLNEVIDLLHIQADGRYVDGTLGLAGHSEAILKRLSSQGRLLGLDVDPTTFEMAKNRLQPFEDQTITRLVNFRGLQGVLHDMGWDEVDGMIFDLGVSSVQLDNGERGFSFSSDAPLDMRLNPNDPQTALSCLKQINGHDFENLLREFGEARDARRISRYLLNDIAQGKINTTKDLAQFCERVLGRRGKTHPATRVFLALRCLVNQELDALDDLLNTAPQYLAVDGRMAVISFHSLEDRRVKEKFRTLAKEGLSEKRFQLVTKKPVVPTESEIKFNPRSRSAKLRVLERTA